MTALRCRGVTCTRIDLGGINFTAGNFQSFFIAVDFYPIMPASAAQRPTAGLDLLYSAPR
jgi:hypothetical protein